MRKLFITFAPMLLVASSCLPWVRAEDYVVDEEAEHHARAQSLHAGALKLAMAGQEADALYDFEEAFELEPTNFVYAADLGVVQMRVGLLDEALNTFMSAGELQPGTKLIQDNLKALQEHLDWREKQSNGSPEDL
jgi:Flp pilus assembly protein TadD